MLIGKACNAKPVPTAASTPRLTYEWLRREFEKRTPFRAVRSRKPNESAQKEAAAAQAALIALCGGHENDKSKYPPGDSIKSP